MSHFQAMAFIVAQALDHNKHVSTYNDWYDFAEIFSSLLSELSVLSQLVNICNYMYML